MASADDPELPVVLPAQTHTAHPVGPDLLALLRSPGTGSELVQQGDHLCTVHMPPGGEQLRYAVIDGIPDLVAPVN